MTRGLDPEDLTARARIRDAAMLEFGEHGFDKATIRGIAKAAGVSSGLVRHHFGAKQELRDACDDYLIRLINRITDEMREDPKHNQRNYVAVARRAIGPYQRYFVRALAEGQAAPVFDEMVRISAEFLAEADAATPNPPPSDPRVRAALITAMALAVPLLEQQLARTLGIDLSSAEGDRVLALALIDIHSHPLLSLEDAATARAALSGDLPQEEPR